MQAPGAKLSNSKIDQKVFRNLNTSSTKQSTQIISRELWPRIKPNQTFQNPRAIQQLSNRAI
jgi:hypothetical protein